MGKSTLYVYLTNLTGCPLRDTRLWRNRHLRQSPFQPCTSLLPSVPMISAAGLGHSPCNKSDAMGVVSLQWAVCSHRLLICLRQTDFPWKTLAGVTLSNFRPVDPPVVSTPDRVYQSAIATKSRLIFCVPAFLEVCLCHMDK